MPDAPQPEDIRLATAFAQEHPEHFPNETTLDYVIRNRESNGLSAAGAILLINGQIYIHVPKYMAAMASKVA